MSDRDYRHDVQGRLGGVPYDFRRPSLGKIVARMANPRAKMITPKPFGVGWTLNLAHPGTWAVLAAAGALAALLATLA